MPIKTVLQQESTKDIMTAGFGGVTVLISSIADINLVLNALVGLGALVLTALRIFSWFERRKQRKLKKE